jgi:hypothetical protein
MNSFKRNCLLRFQSERVHVRCSHVEVQTVQLRLLKESESAIILSDLHFLVVFEGGDTPNLVNNVEQLMCQPLLKKLLVDADKTNTVCSTD